MQTECLLHADPQAHLTIKARFLHLVVHGEQEGNQPGHHGKGSLVQTWQEAVERQVITSRLSLHELVGSSHRCEFAFPFTQQLEPSHEVESDCGPGLRVRRQQAIEGFLEVSAERVGSDLFKVRARLENLTPLEHGDRLTREEALAWSLISTHALLGVWQGKFLSMLDTPGMIRDPAGACQNLRTWPVLVGERGQRDTMLSAPIILDDYPEVAPESPGDLFDGTEMDEMLTLRIRTLTPEEKQEMADLDPRVAEILQRSEALSEERLLGLHGAWRNGQDTPLRSPPALVRVGDVDLEPGMRVRLRPRGNADVFDLALAGETAVIVSIEQDFEDRLYVSVALDDDPGQDLGLAGKPGHRFFFRPDEVEPLEIGGGG